MTIKNRNNLISAIRCGLSQESINAVLSAEDCDELMKICMRQSIQPIVYRGLKWMHVSADCLDQFEKAWVKDVYKFIQSDEALRKIMLALNEKKVPYVPLKGAILRDLYPIPDMRTSRDIDILIREEELDKAVRAIEERTDFKYVQRNYHDVLMKNARVALELHFSIKENMDNIDKLLSRAWDYAEPTGDGSRYVFTPEYQVFHIVAHMSYHLVHGGLGIRPYLDLWMLRNKTTFDEEKVRQMCAECGILTFYEKSCRLADTWMEGKPIPEDLAALEEYCLSGGVFGNSESVNASRMRNRRKSEYIVNRLFANKEVLEEEYPELREKPYLRPVFLMKRWMKILSKGKLASVIKEIKGIHGVSAEAVDEFDEVLRDMGL